MSEICCCLLFVLVVVGNNNVEGRLEGDNVCRTEVTTPEIVVEHQVKNGTVRKYQWCWNVPPRCSFYTKQNLNISKEVVRNVTKVVEFCCDGYKEIQQKCLLECVINNNCKTKENIDEFKNEFTTNSTENMEMYSELETTTITNKYYETNTENSNNNNTSTRTTTSTTTTETSVTFIKLSIEKTEDIKVDHTLPISTTQKATAKNIEISPIFYIKKSEETTTQEVEILASKEDFLSYENSHENIENLVPYQRQNSYFLHGTIIALIGSIIMIITATIVVTLKHNKGKKNKEGNNANNKANHVAVYTASASIFHTPLPEPPTFDNLTYLNSNQIQSSYPDFSNGTLITFEPKIFEKKLPEHSKLSEIKETIAKEYEYDHPPSTGSYRAASSVDGISTITVDDNVSCKNQQEHLYAEIQSKDDTIRQESYYVNTLCKTQL